MGRIKIPMQHITDFKKRKLTFERRKTGMFKKAFELSTLCDVNVSMIIYTDDQQNPEIFPRDSQKLNSLIDVYRKNHSSDCRKNKCSGLSGFLKDRNVKIEQELADAKKKNVEGKYPTWFDYLKDFSETDLREFGLQLDDKIDIVKTRLESIKNGSEIQDLYQGSCNGNVVTDDNSFVLDDSMGLYGVEDESSNHIFVNSNTANHPFKSTMSQDDNDCFWPVVCNNLGYDGFELNGTEIVSMESSNQDFEDEDNPFFLPSSPERAHQFCEMWFSSTSDGDGLLYGF